MKPDACIPVMIAAPAGVMASSLRTFLNTIPEVHVTAQAGDCAELLRVADRIHPRLVLLDADLPGFRLEDGLNRLLQLSPAPRVVVLVSSPAQQQAALAAGSICALMKGFLNDQLRAAILNGLADPTPSH